MTAAVHTAGVGRDGSSSTLLETIAALGSFIPDDPSLRPGSGGPAAGPGDRGRVGPDGRDRRRPRARGHSGGGAGGATGRAALPGKPVPQGARGVGAGYAGAGSDGPPGPGRPGPRRWLRRHPRSGHAGVVRRAGAGPGPRRARRRGAVRDPRGCAGSAGRDARAGPGDGDHAHTPDASPPTNASRRRLGRPRWPPSATRRTPSTPRSPRSSTRWRVPTAPPWPGSPGSHAPTWTIVVRPWPVGLTARG